MTLIFCRKLVINYTKPVGIVFQKPIEIIGCHVPTMYAAFTDAANAR